MKLTTSVTLLFSLAAASAKDDLERALRGGGIFNENANNNGNGNNGPSNSDGGPEMVMDRRQQVLNYWNANSRFKSVQPRHMYIDNDDSPGNNGGARRLQTVNEAAWESAGDVLEAAGRLLFTMDRDYLCSATAVTDGTTGRSIILTAGHCIYDDSSKKFATNVLFIPNQDDGGTDGSDTACGNDPKGCWVGSFGVVDKNWASKSWSNNIPWDYAFIVVDDDASNHISGYEANVPDELDQAVPALDISFVSPAFSGTSHALGYSGSQDPDFRYCVQALQTSSYEGYVLDGCGLTGGSSGGPWIEVMDANGRGEIIAVNSYGPGRGKSYMGGPRLYDNSAECLFQKAKNQDVSAAGNGIVVTYTGDCDSSTVESEGSGPSPSPPSVPGTCGSCKGGSVNDYDRACCDYFGVDMFASKVTPKRITCTSC